MAYLFDDASSEYITAAVAPVTALPMTVGMWVRATDATISADQYFFYYGDSSSGSSWFTLSFLASTEGAIRVWMRDTGAGGTNTGATSFSDQAWHHVMATYFTNGSSERDCELFVDGVSYGNGADASPTGIGSFDRVAIGMLRDSSPGNPFSGDVAELGMWNTQLGLAEAETLYAGYAPPMVSPASLVMYNPLVRNPNDIVGGFSLSTTGGTPTISAHPRIIYPRSRRTPWQSVVAAGGLSIPVAMHHYTKNVGAR